MILSSSSKTVHRLPLGRIMLIAAGVACILGVLLILSNGESAPQDSSAVSPNTGQNQTAPITGEAVPIPAEVPPGQWLQASSGPGGNPAWAPAVTAPFDTLWILSTGREIFTPPAVIGDHIYLAGNDMTMRALNRQTGSRLWSRTAECGFSGGVAADSHRVYFPGQDGYVYALDVNTGSEVWKTGLGYHVFTDACVLADSLVLAGNSMGSLAALDASTGDLVWSGTMNGLLIGPAASGDTAVFSSEAGQVAAWDIQGNTLWTRNFMSQPSAPSISGGRVFLGFSSGKVLALQLSSGETIWETALEGVAGRTVVSRPAVYRDSLLVAGTCDSRVVCLSLSGGELLWETALENWVAVTPAVCDTIVYASSDDGSIHLLSLNTGLPIDTLLTGSYSGTPPILMDGILYAGNSAGDFLALAGTAPSPTHETEQETDCPAE